MFCIRISLNKAVKIFVKPMPVSLLFEKSLAQAESEQLSRISGTTHSMYSLAAGSQLLSAFQPVQAPCLDEERMVCRLSYSLSCLCGYFRLNRKKVPLMPDHMTSCFTYMPMLGAERLFWVKSIDLRGLCPNRTSRLVSKVLLLLFRAHT